MAVALSVNLMTVVKPIAMPVRVSTRIRNYVKCNPEELKSKPCTRVLAAELDYLYVQGYLQVSRKI